MIERLFRTYVSITVEDTTPHMLAFIKIYSTLSEYILVLFKITQHADHNATY